MPEVKRRRNRCVYCGDPFGGDTKRTYDHIPPKSLIPARLKKNLLTVPCCSGCQEGTAKDDDWFRDMLVLDKRTPDSIRNELEPKIHRSWEDSVEKKLSRTSRITKEAAVTTSGLLIPQLIINPDHFRLGRVISRILKALLYVEKGYTEGLRNSYTWGWSWEAFKPDRQLKLWRKRVVDTLANVESRTVGGILTYRAKFFEPPIEKRGNGPGGLWLLLFYDHIPFLGYSGREHVDNKRGVYCNKYQRIESE